MVIPGGLERLFDLLRIPVFSGLGQFNNCPVCNPMPHDPRTMRIFPTIDGDFVFRCHQCAEVWDTLELTCRVLGVSWREASTSLYHGGVTDGEFPEAEIEAHRQLEEIERLFVEGHRQWLLRLTREQQAAWCGDWAIVPRSAIFKLLPSADPGRHGLDDHSSKLVGRRIDIYGRVSGFVLLNKHYMPATFDTVRTGTPVEFSASRWAGTCDWTQIILCTSWQGAVQMDRVVWTWPPEKRLPVVCLERAEWWPLIYNSVFEKVWLVAWEDDRVDDGLILWREHETDVRVKRMGGPAGVELPLAHAHTRDQICNPDLPSVIDVAADEVVLGQEGNRVHRLSKLLRRTRMVRPTQMAILERCSDRFGVPVEKLLDLADLGSSPYGVQSRGKFFVARAGRYLMRDPKNRWSEISNFTVRIIWTEVDEKGDAIHTLLLSVDGETARFDVTAALLDDPARLWKAIRRCAAREELPQVLMANGQHRALLPELIKSMTTPAESAGGRPPIDPGVKNASKKEPENSESDVPPEATVPPAAIAKKPPISLLGLGKTKTLTGSLDELGAERPQGTATP